MRHSVESINIKRLTKMNPKHLIAAIVAVCVIAGTTNTFAADPGTVVAKATLTEAKAGKLALKKVPNGKLGEGELEMEKGVLVYSFDISLPDSKSIVEVQVNAVTGAIVDVGIESPADQAKEAAEDAKTKEKDEEKEKK